MTLENGTYYFRPRGTRARTNLGKDGADAYRRYVAMTGHGRSCRTLRDVIEQYRLEVLPKKRSASTRKHQDAALLRLQSEFGDKLPDELTAAECDEYVARRVTRKIVRASGKVIEARPAPVAARHEITLLGHVLAKAIRWGVARTNVVRTLDRKRHPRATRLVSDEEVAAIKALASPRMRLVIGLARHLSDHRVDLLGLRREQVTGKGLVIRRGRNGVDRVIEMTPALAAIVDALVALPPRVPGEFLVRTEKGERYSRGGFAANWQRLMARYVGRGGRRFTFRDLRGNREKA